jgi:hypothetical protein
MARGGPSNVEENEPIKRLIEDGASTAEIVKTMPNRAFRAGEARVVRLGLERGSIVPTIARASYGQKLVSHLDHLDNSEKSGDLPMFVRRIHCLNRCCTRMSRHRCLANLKKLRRIGDTRA